MSTWKVHLKGAPGSLERFLGICRRRRFDLVELHVGPGAPEGTWSLNVTFGGSAPPATRILPILARDHDVLAIASADGSEAGTVSRSS